MTKYRLEQMVRGWFVGDFAPAVLRTAAAEVGVKIYHAGDHEPWHYHKVAPEVTVVVAGQVRLNENRYGPGDIIRIDPGEGTDFEALTDATTVVVKIPSVIGDKYQK